MLKNKIVMIIIACSLIIPCYAVIDEATPDTNNVSQETIVVEEDAAVQNEEIANTTPYKQPLSKRKIIKKFILAMIGVCASSLILYIGLTLYNKVRNGSLLSNNRPSNDKSSLDTPETLAEAVKTFVEKTDWEN